MAHIVPFVTEDESRQLLDLVRLEGVRAFFAQIPAQLGTINPDEPDPA